jgi:hypothetical protein
LLDFLHCQEEEKNVTRRQLLVDILDCANGQR